MIRYRTAILPRSQLIELLNVLGEGEWKFVSWVDDEWRHYGPSAGHGRDSEREALFMRVEDGR